MRFNRFSMPAGIPAHRIRHLYSASLLNILLILLACAVFFPSLIQVGGLSVDLPRVITSEPVSQKSFIVIIQEDGSFFLSGRRRSIQELKHFFSSVKERNFSLMIKSDRRAQVKALVEIWDLARSAGAQQVSIATND